MEKDERDARNRSSGSSPTSTYECALASHKDGFLRQIWDGFKRDPNASITRLAALGADGKVFDVEAAAQRTADSPLARRLKGRHLQMIAIGGSIGGESHPVSPAFWCQPLILEKGRGFSSGRARRSQRVAPPLYSLPFR